METARARVPGKPLEPRRGFVPLAIFMPPHTSVSGSSQTSISSMVLASRSLR